MKKLSLILSTSSGFIALLLLLLTGPSYRLQWLALGQAFSVMRWTVYLGIASIIVIIGYSLWQKPRKKYGRWLALSALAGLCAAYVPLSQVQQARSVPAIHDISTDLVNPPRFIKILALRKDAPNASEYGGKTVARQQRQAYPNIKPLVLTKPLTPTYQKTLTIAKKMHWHIIASELTTTTARIEATATTFWFGFKDDLIIRLQAIKGGTRIDMRSVSRVGKSDLGKNAQRIRDFMQASQP